MWCTAAGASQTDLPQPFSSPSGLPERVSEARVANRIHPKGAESSRFKLGPRQTSFLIAYSFTTSKETYLLSISCPLIRQTSRNKKTRVGRCNTTFSGARNQSQEQP